MSKRSRQRGHAMIELAVSAGVMVACLAGTVQFGYTFYIYNQLVTAVGNGGRYAAMRTFAPRSADIEKGKPRSATWWSMAMRARPNALPQVANLKPEQVQVDWVMDETRDAASASWTSRSPTTQLTPPSECFASPSRPAVEYPFVGRFAPAESEK